MSRRGLAWAVAVTGLLASPALSSEVVHSVGEGETFSDVALRYWGDPELGELVRTHNRLPADGAQTGAKLAVPVPWEWTVEPGESWTSLARSALGNPALAEELARINGRSGSDPLHSGETILIPALATHRLRRGETLAVLARRYLGSTGSWQLLARLNRFGNPHSLKPGTEVVIPVVRRGKDDEPVPDEPERVEEPRDDGPVAAVGAGADVTESGLREPLQAAVADYREGRYEEALTQLEQIRSEVLARGTGEERAELLETLVFVKVAFDLEEEVCEAYLALRSIAPVNDWSPDRVSPKVFRMTSVCEAH
ncbi:MAG: LysM domain-containing protein [Myxococcota bacterium]